MKMSRVLLFFFLLNEGKHNKHIKGINHQALSPPVAGKNSLGTHLEDVTDLSAFFLSSCACVLPHLCVVAGNAWLPGTNLKGLCPVWWKW